MAIIALLPCNTSDLPKLPDHIAPPTASIAHTLTVCDRCGRDCWIGPEQRKALRLAQVLLVPTPKLCYLCALTYIEIRRADMELIGLKSEADELPRRP